MQVEFGNIGVIRTYPRKSTRFAKEKFGDKEIDVCEIGVFRGRNSKSILKTLNVKSFLAVDPFKDYGGYDDFIKEEIEEAFKEFSKILKDPRVTLVREKSEDVARSEAWVGIPKFFDFIYIDGNHEYEYVKKDLELWFPRLKTGGIIAGHDCNGWEIMKAVSEFAVKHKLKLRCENLDWWMQREDNI